MVESEGALSKLDKGSAEERLRVLAVDCKSMPREELAIRIAESLPVGDVVVCSSASEVLERSDIATFDVAFVGIGATEMDGIELARKLKRFNPRMSIMFAAGYGEHMSEVLKTPSTGYLMKPVTIDEVAAELDSLHHHPVPAAYADSGLFVRCFGHFEVFVDGQALAFDRSKAKELFAFLIDRKGAVVSLREVEAAMWEDTPPSGQRSGSYLRTLVANLRRTLASCGYEDVLVKRRGELGIDRTRITCDYYDYLHGDPSAINCWRGEYMAQYPWAEATAANLMQNG